jgi:hypothetical protein
MGEAESVRQYDLQYQPFFSIAMQAFKTTSTVPEKQPGEGHINAARWNVRHPLDIGVAWRCGQVTASIF